MEGINVRTDARFVDGETRALGIRAWPQRGIEEPLLSEEMGVVRIVWQSRERHVRQLEWQRDDDGLILSVALCGERG
jgi:hypothetical protein